MAVISIPPIVEMPSGRDCGFQRAGAMAQSSGIQELQQNLAHNKSTDNV